MRLDSSPEEHRRRLDRTVRLLWIATAWIVVVLVAGGLAYLAGW